MKRYLPYILAISAFFLGLWLTTKLPYVYAAFYLMLAMLTATQLFVDYKLFEKWYQERQAQKQHSDSLDDLIRNFLRDFLPAVFISCIWQFMVMGIAQYHLNFILEGFFLLLYAMLLFLLLLLVNYQSYQKRMDKYEKSKTGDSS